MLYDMGRKICIIWHFCCKEDFRARLAFLDWLDMIRRNVKRAGSKFNKASKTNKTSLVSLKIRSRVPKKNANKTTKDLEIKIFSTSN